MCFSESAAAVHVAAMRNVYCACRCAKAVSSGRTRLTASCRSSRKSKDVDEGLTSA